MKNSLSWDFNRYTPDSLRSRYNEKQLRAEYTKLRDIAQKRLKRMAESEFKDSMVYLENKDKFEKLSQIKNKTQLVHALADVAGFVNAKTSSISGLKNQRKEAIKTLHEHGYDFVDKDNYEEFYKFMEDYRNKKLNQIYDSERVAELFEAAKDKKIKTDELKKDFEFWIKNEEKLKAMNLPKNKKQTAANYRKAIMQDTPKSRQKTKSRKK